MSSIPPTADKPVPVTLSPELQQAILAAAKGGTLRRVISIGLGIFLGAALSIAAIYLSLPTLARRLDKVQRTVAKESAIEQERELQEYARKEYLKRLHEREVERAAEKARGSGKTP